jgi:hypothetical protein
MHRLHSDIHRYRWFILSVCALALFLRWWGMQGKPERLMDLPEWGGFHAIHGGRFYRLVQDPQENVIILSMPVEGGKETEVFRERAPGATAGPISVSDAGITYSLKRSVLPPAWMVTQARRKAAAARRASKLRPSPKPKTPPAMAGSSVPEGPRLYHYFDVHIVPLSGGPARVFPEPDGRQKGVPTSVASVVQAGQSLYWLERRVTGARIIVPPKGPEYFSLDTQTLIRTAPLRGGPARTVEVPTFGYSTLWAGETGLLWTGPLSGRPKDLALTWGDDFGLYYLADGAAEPRLLRTYDNQPLDVYGRSKGPTTVWTIEGVVEHKGRVLYHESVTRSSGSTAVHPTTERALVTCRTDGTDYPSAPCGSFIALGYDRRL